MHGVGVLVVWLAKARCSHGFVSIRVGRKRFFFKYNWGPHRKYMDT